MLRMDSGVDNEVWHSAHHNLSQKQSWEKHGLPKFFKSFVHRLRMGSREQPNILDFGCGKGDIAIALALALPTARVVGVDIDNIATSIATSISFEKGIGNQVKFVQGDGLDYLEGLEDESLDGIVDSLVSTHFPPEQRARFIRLAHQKLIPGGLYGHKKFSGHDGFFYDTEIAGLFGRPVFKEGVMSYPPTGGVMYNVFFREEDIKAFYEGKFKTVDSYHLPHPVHHERYDRYLWDILAQKV